MGISISLALLFVIIAVIIRYCFIKKPSEKLNATWISAGLTFVATTIYILMNEGTLDTQGSSIVGFTTLVVCYNILTR